MKKDTGKSSHLDDIEVQLCKFNGQMHTNNLLEDYGTAQQYSSQVCS